MTKHCRFIVMTSLLFLLLSFAGSAAAQGAWVLWVSSITYDTTGKAIQAATSAATGAESKTNCLALLKASISDRTEGIESRTRLRT
jgi:hypothetical protein